MVVASFERAIHQNRIGWMDEKEGRNTKRINAIKPFYLLLYKYKWKEEIDIGNYWY